MRLLVSGSTKTVGRLAVGMPEELGILLTPANRNSIASVVRLGLPWGVDNGAFSGFDPGAFRKLAAKSRGQRQLLWVVCPDVVADASGTLALFDQWEPELHASGLPVAFVLQDGQEGRPVPWSRCEAAFVGGSTEWKLGPHAAALATEAKRRGLWLHMGRVNSLRRMRYAYDLGCDSVDGSSMSMYGDKYIHRFMRWIRRLKRQRTLFA